MQNTKQFFISFTILVFCVVTAVRADGEVQSVRKEIIAAETLANVPGYKMTAVIVDVAPGVVTPSHRHGGFVFVYVLEGTAQSQLNGGEIIEYKAGQSWVEPPGVIHSHAMNPSETEAAKILTIFITKEDAQLTTMESAH